MYNKDNYATQELNIEEFISETNFENAFLLKLKESGVAKKSDAI